MREIGTNINIFNYNLLLNNKLDVNNNIIIIKYLLNNNNLINNNNNTHSEKYAHLFILFLFKKDSFIGFKRDIFNGINSAVSVLITIILIFTY